MTQKKSFSLFGGVSDAPKLTTVELAVLFGDPDQPRKQFDDEALLELSESIKEKGILQAPLVRPNPSGEGYLIIAGERRCRAAKLAGLTEIDVKIHEGDDYKTLALIENLQRKDLKPVEEAQGLKKLLDEDKTLNQTSLAQMVGKNRLTINALLKIATLPEEIQNESLKLDTPKTILIELSQLSSQEAIFALWTKARDGNLTVAEIRNFETQKQENEIVEKAVKIKTKIKSEDVTKIIKTGQTWLNNVKGVSKKSLDESDKQNLIELRDEINKIIAVLAE